MRRVLSLIRPAAIVLVELELWPNHVRHARKRGVRVVLVNGRISDHSFRGYSKLRAFTRRILPMLDVMCAQSDVDAMRFIALGAPADRVHVLGTAKYDVAQVDHSGEKAAREILDKAGMGGIGRSFWGDRRGMGRKLRF